MESYDNKQIQFLRKLAFFCLVVCLTCSFWYKMENLCIILFTPPFTLILPYLSCADLRNIYLTTKTYKQIINKKKLCLGPSGKYNIKLLKKRKYNNKHKTCCANYASITNDKNMFIFLQRGIVQKIELSSIYGVELTFDQICNEKYSDTHYQDIQTLCSHYPATFVAQITSRKCTKFYQEHRKCLRAIYDCASSYLFAYASPILLDSVLRHLTDKQAKKILSCHKNLLNWKHSVPCSSRMCSLFFANNTYDKVYMLIDDFQILCDTLNLLKYKLDVYITFDVDDTISDLLVYAFTQELISVSNMNDSDLTGMINLGIIMLFHKITISIELDKRMSAIFDTDFMRYMHNTFSFTDYLMTAS